MIRLLGACLLAGSAAAAQGLSGTVVGSDATPIGLAYVGLMTPGFEPVTYAVSRPNGEFTLGESLDQGLLVVQPPASVSLDQGLKSFPYAPRIYRLGDERELALELPAVSTIVLCGYDSAGNLMRWRDYEALGKHGGQFAYATNLRDEAQPATVWPVHGDLIGLSEGPREEGLPALLVPPGEPYAVRVLFWPVPTYGKLMLALDNAGDGFEFEAPGKGLLLNLNVELARTAIDDLLRRQTKYADAFQRAIDGLAHGFQGHLQDPPADPAALAKLADTALAQALAIRDAAELEAAQRAIPDTRMGALQIALEGVEAPEEFRIEVKQQRHDFLFGVFEGSPYNAQAFETAREAGFEYATILPAWNWTQSPKIKKREIDEVFGITRLKELGYLIKAHGVVWMQEYGLLPERAMEMTHSELHESALEHQQALLEVFGDDFDVVEAMNEPAATNVVKLARDQMIQLLGATGENIRRLKKETLVNSPHEFGYGASYLVYRPDGTPVEDYPLTYSAFLDLAQEQGALDQIDIIGLQFYPGFHLNADWGNLQGPAYTPAHLLDILERYARFGKTLHITEISFPSSYGDDWHNGYWREPWNESIQADYAEAVYTLAFAHPQVNSITWWDIMDTKPAVITGGLLHDDGAPKPVFERLSSLIEGWTTEEELTPDTGGAADIRVFAGEYLITAVGPDGARTEATAHVAAGATEKVILEAGT